ncbi:hypothetical protein DFH09DRAFT_1341305 [Mycena vulgaris]|nr:hypothetical protein DFH09DRAFT_1341305 [Mycena vulgaris]
MQRDGAHVNAALEVYNEELLDDKEDEEDLDVDLEDDTGPAAALESSVREMALGDWARGRLLDDAWVAPADIYYGMRVGGCDGPEVHVKVVHPVPCTVTVLARRDGAACPTARAPRRADAPATDQLARRGRTRGPPAPAARSAPPALAQRRAARRCRARRGGWRAARMSLGDAVREEEDMWFDGVEWRERKRNARAGAREAKERQRRHRGQRSEDSSEAGSRRSVTSPVLSTSTLGMTPSPPPPALENENDKDKGAQQERTRAKEAKQLTIAVGPVLDPLRLLRPILYVPETIAHLPYGLEALCVVWREVCAPLYSVSKSNRAFGIIGT